MKDYTKITVSLTVENDDADDVRDELNQALDLIEQEHTLHHVGVGSDVGEAPDADEEDEA